jgi:hypothetical protein
MVCRPEYDVKLLGSLFFKAGPGDVSEGAGV